MSDLRIVDHNPLLETLMKLRKSGHLSSDGLILLQYDILSCQKVEGEAVAFRKTHFDGSFELCFKDDWQKCKKVEPLYTTPQPASQPASIALPESWVSLQTVRTELERLSRGATYYRNLNPYDDPLERPATIADVKKISGYLMGMVSKVFDELADFEMKRIKSPQPDRVAELEAKLQDTQMKLRTAESALDNLQSRFGNDNRQLLGSKRLALGQCYQALKIIRGQ